MPKEVINHSVPHRAPVCSNDPAVPDVMHTWEDPELTVSWSGYDESNHVQVYLDTPVSYLRNLADNVGDEARQRSKVWSIGMDRHQINHLIKALRRARNQVFGADE